ncbi:hypothetical protein [Budvicia diplopodorum]|uniref:hypothetical protein n=1 Tax=Budvicia diplopodorum TaxID=1119056 RepID=UPI0013588881|nr:hypothetical protein [Budvicia diplopodorum]
MDVVKYSYKINRFFVLMVACFFGGLANFTINRIGTAESELAVGKLITLTAGQTKSLLIVVVAIFILLALMSLTVLVISFLPRQNVVFSADAVSYPTSTLRNKTAVIKYDDIQQLQRVNSQHNEALQITTTHGKFMILRSMLKNDKTFAEIYDLLKKRTAV